MYIAITAKHMLITNLVAIVKDRFRARKSLSRNLLKIKTLTKIKKRKEPVKLLYYLLSTALQIDVMFLISNIISEASNIPVEFGSAMNSDCSGKPTTS